MPVTAATADPVLEVTDFSCTFSTAPGAPPLIDGLSFSVAAGQTLCLVGESGCGKSMTALALMGLLPRPAARITAGSARFEGRDLFALPERELANLRGNRLAMIFQEPMTALDPSYTVGEQIVEGVRRHQRGMSRGAARRRALEMLELVRIPAAETRLSAYAHQLSGGMRQRVMIAMALANSPRLVIADEPTTALDVTIQAQVLDLIGRLQAKTGAALLLITHDLGVVAKVADHVAVMYAGCIVEYGSVDALFDDPQHPYTIGLMGAMPSSGRRSERLATIRGSVPAPADMPIGCRFAPRCPFAVEHCRHAAPPARELGPAPGHRVACWRAPVEDAGPEAGA